MKTVIINEDIYKKLFENIEDEGIYNSPDMIQTDDACLTWRDKDAKPFFLLPNNKIVFGTSRRTHNDYINSIQDPKKQREFINSVLLQGRYWEDSNSFSFWNMSSDDMGNVKKTVRLIGKLNKPCYIYYKDKVFEVRNDKDYMYLRELNKIKDENNVLDEKKINFFEHWFESDMNFVKAQYVMTTFKGGVRDFRPLNDYELFAATCYQVWTDFLRKEREDVSTEDFKLFIDLKTHGRITFDSAFDYFHKNMRKKMTTKNSVKTDFKWDGEEATENTNIIENFLETNNVDDTEYNVTFYDNSNKPYSYEVKIYNDKEKAVNAINNAKADEKLVVDRVGVRKVQNDNVLFTFRIRLKPEFDEFWN